MPKELQDLTWIEEALVARSHLSGRVLRLEERRAGEPKYSSLKGHVVLVPQQTLPLLDILPLSLDALADLANVVWVGKAEPDIKKIAAQFTVRKHVVISALQWLRENNKDYKNVVIDHAELDRWPSVFIVDMLLNSMGKVRSGAEEDASRNGFATEEALEAELLDGDLPNTTSAILDMNNTARPRQWLLLDKVQSLKTNGAPDVTINVVPGSNILEPRHNPAYYTSAFPTLFPWGIGKHTDERRNGNKLSLKRWTQLLLRHSSR